LWKSLFDQYYPGININSRSIQGWKHVFNSDRNFLVAKLICFHTKASFKDSILGIPISYSINPRTQQIDKITSTLDLLSYGAYVEDGIRKSVWKQKFTHFLPLYINSEHATRALPVMQKFFAELCISTEFKPYMVLEIIPKLMNTMVVSLISGNIHASIVALEGYCSFHRLFIIFY